MREEPEIDVVENITSYNSKSNTGIIGIIETDYVLEGIYDFADRQARGRYSEVFTLYNHSLSEDRDTYDDIHLQVIDKASEKLLTVDFNNYDETVENIVYEVTAYVREMHGEEDLSNYRCKIDIKHGYLSEAVGNFDNVDYAYLKALLGVICTNVLKDRGKRLIHEYDMKNLLREIKNMGEYKVKALNSMVKYCKDKYVITGFSESKHSTPTIDAVLLSKYLNKAKDEILNVKDKDAFKIKALYYNYVVSHLMALQNDQLSSDIIYY